MRASLLRSIRKCGSYIGIAYEEIFPLPSLGSDYCEASSGNGARCSKSIRSESAHFNHPLKSQINYN
ncbi:hypothetical protein M5K25_022060 [Dendrobium thyrsiflorum]|uniref:Uncharacterized protein n=1 Tax=Dendrobium thyrsiflorum TaxID=117978 RepID=A0ABD0U606_DENTH